MNTTTPFPRDHMTATQAVDARLGAKQDDPGDSNVVVVDRFGRGAEAYSGRVAAATPNGFTVVKVRDHFGDPKDHDEDTDEMLASLGGLTDGPDKQPFGAYAKFARYPDVLVYFEPTQADGSIGTVHLIGVGGQFHVEVADVDAQAALAVVTPGNEHGMSILVRFAQAAALVNAIPAEERTAFLVNAVRDFDFTI